MNAPITNKDILNSAKELKSNKAAGHYEMITGYFKDTIGRVWGFFGDVFCLFVCCLFGGFFGVVFFFFFLGGGGFFGGGEFGRLVGFLFRFFCVWFLKYIRNIILY